MSVNPQVVKDPDGTYYVEFDEQADIEIYAILGPGGPTRTFKPALHNAAGRARVKLGKGWPEPVTATVTPQDVVSRAPESDSYPDPPPPPPLDDETYAGVLATLELPMPAGAVKLTGGQQFIDLIRTGAPGDYDATQIDVASVSRAIASAKAPKDHPIRVWTSPRVRLENSSLLTDPALEFVGGQHIEIYGPMDVTNPEGTGINARGASSSVPCQGCKVVGAVVHSPAGGGISCHGNSGPVDDLLFFLEVDAWWAGKNAALDPHAVKGTGVHAAYIGQNPGTYPCTNIRVGLFAHDSDSGGCLQWSHLVGYEFWVWAKNLSMQDPPAGADGTRGNVLQPFDGSSDKGVVHIASGENVRKMLNQVGSGGHGGQLQVLRGRGVNVATANSGRVSWDKQAGTLLVDCAPLP